MIERSNNTNYSNTRELGINTNSFFFVQIIQITAIPENIFFLSFQKLFVQIIQITAIPENWFPNIFVSLLFK